MLWILCVDGLGYNLWKEFGLELPYEGEMKIPEECYRNQFPFTPDVWGSMFLGEVFKHPRSNESEINPLRLKARTFLRNKGIKWSRRGTKIKFENTAHIIPSYFVFEQMNQETVFDEYESFKWGIPSVCDGFLFKSYEGNVQDHEAFKSMVYSQYCRTFDLVGIYTHLIDEVAHRAIKKRDQNYRKLKYLYNEIFFLYETLAKKNDVLVVSDHSCFGNHGDLAFIGSNKKIRALNILDVYNEVKERMKNQRN
ncbi:hypothetical protein ACFL0D_01910 [Thermoproteota archaeon]